MNYTLKMNGCPIKIYETTVNQPPYNHTEKMPFAIIPYTGSAEYELTSEIPVESVTIRPLRLGIKATFDEHTIRFTMDRPEKISVEINGSYRNNIVLLASEARDEQIDLRGKNIIRFAPGEYKQDLAITQDNTVVYLETGVSLQGRIDATNCENFTLFVDHDAIIHGKLHIEKVNNVKLCGFGAICSERYNRGSDARFFFQADIRFCRNVTIHDLSFLDSCVWTCRVFGCDDVYIDNINIFGCRGNSDGVDICGTRNALVEHCFMRTWDDCFVAKAFDTGNLENVTFRNSTLWNDFARPLEVGVEIRADYARNIKFENIDIIHSVTGYPTMGIHHGDRGKLRNIEFSDIRIEDAPGGQIFDIRITNSVWNEDTSVGDIDGLTIRNIFLNGEQEILPARSRLQGYTKDNMIRNVLLENICYHGKYATNLEECHVNVMDFVENVTVKYPENEPKMNLIHTNVTVTEPFSLQSNGMYSGTVQLLLENKNSDSVSGRAKLQVSPVNMIDIPDNDIIFDLAPNEKITKEYQLTLQPGRYVFALQSRDPAVEATWHYQELPLLLTNNIDTAPVYKIINYYGNLVDDVRLAASNNKLIIRSEALRNNTFTVYSAAPVESLPGEVKFTVEETDFGEALAVMDGLHGNEAAPQLRCPAEITYVFKNEPKVKKIHKNTLGGAGSNTIEIPFSLLGVDDGATNVWFDVVANLPEVADYRYAFSMFHSVLPNELAHMYARAYLS